MALSLLSIRFLFNTEERPNSLNNKADLSALMVSGVVIAAVATIAALILTQTYSFGLPMGVGTVSNHLAWGLAAAGGTLLIIETLVLAIRLCHKTPIPREEQHALPPAYHAALQYPRPLSSTSDVTPHHSPSAYYDVVRSPNLQLKATGSFGGMGDAALSTLDEELGTLG